MDEWKRLGDCKRCGECCKHLAFLMSVGVKKEDVDDFVDFYARRGIKAFHSEHLPNGIFTVMVPSRCSQLKDDNTCAVQKDKPLSCRVQPVKPWFNEGLGCAYRWERKEAVTK